MFSSPVTNVIYRWSPVGTVEVFRAKSGHSGVDIGGLATPGSRGLTFDPQGRLVICEHGNRRVFRIEPHGNLTVLADGHCGVRLAGPIDVVVRGDGVVFFTDAPPGPSQAPGAVYAVVDGEVRLVTTGPAAPAGLALSPDGDVLYVADTAPGCSVVTRHEVDATGTVAATGVPVDLGDGPAGGLVVDIGGTLYVCGPGGIGIVAPGGRRLGLLRCRKARAT